MTAPYAPHSVTLHAVPDVIGFLYSDGSIGFTEWTAPAAGTVALTHNKILIGDSGDLAAEVTPSGDWTIADTGVATLATVNANVGTFGSATQSVQFTVNAKGLITAAANVTIAGVSPVGAALTRGSIFRGSAASLVEALAKGSAGAVLTGDGTDTAFSTYLLSGTAGGTTSFAVTSGKTLTFTATDNSSITFTGAGALTIPTAGAVTAALLATANVFTTTQTIQTGADAAIGLVIKRNSATQTANLQQWQSSTGAVLASIESDGTYLYGATSAVGETADIKYALYASGDQIVNVAVLTFSSASSTYRSDFQMERGRGTSASPAAVASGDYLGALSFLGWGSSVAGGRALPAQIACIVDGTVASASVPAKLSFITGTASGTRVERLAISSAGVVTITRNDTTAGILSSLVIDRSNASPANNDGQAIIFQATDSTTAAQAMARAYALWVDKTHASRKSRAVFTAYDTAEREGLRIEASGTAPMIGFYGGGAVARGAALTTQLTTITYTAPGTPDYALQDLVDSSGGATFGFATKDEGNTFISVVKNLQDRVAELEARLGSATGVNLFA